MKRIDIINKNSSYIYTCVNGILINIECLRGNVRTAQTVALLLERDINEVCEYRILVLNVRNSEERISVTFNDSTLDWCNWGTVAELRSGELVAKTSAMRTVIVWKMGEQITRQLSIPVEDYYLCSLSVLENVLGKEELIALAFYSNKSIGLFEIEQNKLVLVRIIQLEFGPFWMLWIASKQTLLVSDWNGNKKELFALRLTDNAAFPDNVTLEGCTKIYVRSWCVLRDHAGNEKILMVFDYYTDSIMKFELDESTN